jgi:hypothetical protein
MPFHSVVYDVYVALGDSNAAPLWQWERWRGFAAVVDPLINYARGKAALRSTQFRPGGRETVKFGRLGWKEQDHEKWTHGSSMTREDSETRSFLDVEMWAPSWTQCEREVRPPCVFLSVSNESLAGNREQLLFNPVVVLAVISELAEREQALIPPVLATLRTLTAATLVVRSRRPWGISVGSHGFTNAINDLHVTGLFQPGPRHTREAITLDIFADEWQRVS